jgi:hypothetical protein
VSADPPSGPWAGFYVQGRKRGTMRVSLRFADGRVEGGGSDPDGPFEMRGEYDPDGGVRIEKHYPWLHVSYRGRWDGTLISGRWSFRVRFGLWTSSDQGVFELWPESGETSLESLTAEDLVTA